MPVISLDQLHTYLCDGTIKTYTIDTNIVYAFNFNFNKYPLNTVTNPHKNIVFILPDIVFQEIEKNYIEKYNIQKIIKDISKLVSIKKIEKIYKFIKSIDIKKECSNNLNNFLNPKDNYIIEISNFIQINDIMDRYFNIKYPFENNKDKKCEFPDALALSSLENYALKNDVNILAISDDNGWINYCRDSENLYAIERDYKNPKELLLDCLQAFKNIDTNIVNLIDNISDIISASSEVHTLLKKCVEDYLQNNIDCLTPYCDSAYQYDYEVDYIELIDIDFNIPKIYIESINNGEIVIYCTLLATICGYVTFEEYIWDKEDNESILIDKKSLNKEKEVNFDITIYAKIIDHNLNNIKIVEGNVSPDDIEIDFGSI